jgi:sigma-B regulation protein RsbU (phosphoserine phosphatase)
MSTMIPRPLGDPGVITATSLNSSCDFVQTLMKLQRAAQLITSSLDLDALLERVVTDIAASIGCVEVSVWLRDTDSNDMVLHGVRGCTLHKKGSRLQIGRQGMVGHVAASGAMHYAGDVRDDPYYISCEENTLSEVTLPLKIGGEVIGVLSVDHPELNAFSDEQRIHVRDCVASCRSSRRRLVRLHRSR